MISLVTSMPIQDWVIKIFGSFIPDWVFFGIILLIFFMLLIWGSKIGMVAVIPLAVVLLSTFVIGFGAKFSPIYSLILIVVGGLVGLAILYLATKA